MAGAGLIALRRRIKSINNTKKITSAIRLVANSKLIKSREALNLNNDYNNALKNVMQQILSDNELGKDIYFNGNGSNKKLYIAITSDTGLCGGFNINVVNKTLEHTLKDKNNSCIIIVGQKGIGYFKKYNIESLGEYVGIPDVPTIKDVKTIFNKIQELFTQGKVGEVNVVYTKFTSTVKQEVELKRIFPINKEDILDGREDKNSIIEFDPDRNQIISHVCQLYLKETLLNLMLNSKTSEQAVRMAAMRAASDNANDLLDKLNIKYNRIRQSNITNEISEIVGGAEAQR